MPETPNSIQELGKLGQSLWYDNMYPALITSGDLERLVAMGATGLTSNLMREGVKAFADSFDLLLDDISTKTNRLMALAAAPA